MANVIKFEAYTEPESVSITLNSQEARMLRRMCFFNKTVSAKVSESEGNWAGSAIDAFMCSVGTQLKEQGYCRQIG